MATTSEIIDDVLSDLGENPDDATLSARALRWVIDAYDKVLMYCPEAEFLQKSEMSLTTITDQAAYALPANFFQLLSVRDDTNDTIIEVIPRETFDVNHSDPSSESTGKPYECTLEFDRTNKRHILRLAFIPDAAYVLYAIIRAWPDELSTSVDPAYDKLRICLKLGGIYHGSLILLSDREYAEYRKELKTNFLEATQSMKQIFAMQKPRADQIPVTMKRLHYRGSDFRWR